MDKYTLCIGMIKKMLSATSPIIHLDENKSILIPHAYDTADMYISKDLNIGGYEITR